MSKGPDIILSEELKRSLAMQLLRQREPTRPTDVAPTPRQGTGRSAEIPVAFCSFEHHPGFLALRSRLDDAGQAGAAAFRTHNGRAADTTVINGREYLNFANYDYLGLSGHPTVAMQVANAVERYGTSVSGSRMVGGERPLHLALETALAEIFDAEECLTFVSGHATNVTALGYLFGPKDLILHDALIHNSVIVGAALSGARRIAFRHNDWQAVDGLLARHRHDFERVVVVVEGIYSMDGDYPDLPQFVKIRNRHKIFLMVDEAHSLGVMGARGFGIREHFGIAGKDVDIWMGTLSKSLASCGGYIAGSRALIFTLRYGAPGFVYSVGLAPPAAAAALAALEILKAEPSRVRRLQDRGRFFVERANARNLPIGSAAGLAVIPIIVGATSRCLALAQTLFQRGVNVPPVIHPAVDERKSRLRFFVNCTHSEAQIERAMMIIGEEWRALAPV
jgi:8-amino-7-oxononanoate synthase